MRIQIRMSECDPKKHSIRYNSTDPKAAVQSIYISRKALPLDYPQEVVLEITLGSEE